MFGPRMDGKYGRYRRMKQGRRNAFGTGDKRQPGQRQNSTSKGPREQAVTNGHVLPGSDKRSDATARIRQTSNTSMPGRTEHELVNKNNEMSLLVLLWRTPKPALYHGHELL